MPELPEVETTVNGIKPHITQQIVTEAVCREHRLRWKVDARFKQLLLGKTLLTVERRAKYLIFRFDQGALIWHLGMSGTLRILTYPYLPPEKHDHIDLRFSNDVILRYTDPRRFGACIWVEGDPYQHELLTKLGPEPFDKMHTGTYLFEKSRQRKVPVKTFIMDHHIVVGVGNIYAAEALFMAGVKPQKRAGKVTLQEYERINQAIKIILKQAIKKGGTTLKDFVNSEGKRGYFSLHLQVYGRENQACYVCRTSLKRLVLGQRTTVYCPNCQR